MPAPHGHGLLYVNSLSLEFDLFEGVGLGDVELGDGGAAEGCEMGSAAEALAHFMGDGAHVGSRGDAGAEVGAIGFDRGDGEVLDLDMNRLEDDLFLFSSQFVRGDAVDFLGGKGRRDLVDEAVEFGSEFLEIIQSHTRPYGRQFTQGFTIGVVSIGGKAETDHAFVGLFGGNIKLRQAGERSGDEGEHAGGKRIERAKMADGALLENTAHAVDYVVGGPTGGLVDDDDAIHEEFGNLVVG